METVGVVGVGSMGSVIVERYVAAGLRTLAYDVAPAARERAAAAGATPCASLEEIARVCDPVSVMVATDEQMLDAVLGEGGLLQGLDSGKVLLLHSTMLPWTTRTIGEAARPRGVEVADACITAVPAVFRAGQAACLVGGETDLVQRITAHLLHLTKQVIRVGPLGSGNIAKLMRNLLNGSETLLINEVFQITAAAGIDAEHILPVLQQIYAARDLPSLEQLSRRGPAGNLFDTILPGARSVADAYDVPAPITHLLASVDHPLA